MVGFILIDIQLLSLDLASKSFQRLFNSMQYDIIIMVANQVFVYRKNNDNQKYNILLYLLMACVFFN